MKRKSKHTATAEEVIDAGTPEPRGPFLPAATGGTLQGYGDPATMGPVDFSKIDAKGRAARERRERSQKPGTFG